MKRIKSHSSESSQEQVKNVQIIQNIESWSCAAVPRNDDILVKIAQGKVTVNIKIQIYEHF